MRELTAADDVRRVLKEARTVAVLGAHPEPARPAHYVPDYLHTRGYRILPVNPMFAGRTLWSETVKGTLAEIAEPVDVVEVFRRSDRVPEHVDDILAMQPRPGVVWMQLGVRSDDAARRLIAAGIEVVQDRCMLADHRSFGLGKVDGAS